MGAHRRRPRRHGRDRGGQAIGDGRCRSERVTVGRASSANRATAVRSVSDTDPEYQQRHPGSIVIRHRHDLARWAGHRGPRDMLTATDPEPHSIDPGSLMLDVDGQVISAEALAQRVQRLVESIDAGTLPDGSTTEPADPTLEGWIGAMRHAHSQLHPPDLSSPRGLRGHLGAFVKRIVRRLTSWYVEPAVGASAAARRPGDRLRVDGVRSGREGRRGARRAPAPERPAPAAGGRLQRARYPCAPRHRGSRRDSRRAGQAPRGRSHAGRSTSAEPRGHCAARSPRRGRVHRARTSIRGLRGHVPRRVRRGRESPGALSDPLPSGLRPGTFASTSGADTARC